jgi:hypothetical protein
MDRADRTAMGSDDRLRMICVCKRERAEDANPKANAIVVGFMILSFVLSTQTTNGPSI